MKKECEHHFVKGAEVWEHHGLWKHLVLTIFCEKCGEIIQKTLDKK